MANTANADTQQYLADLTNLCQVMTSALALAQSLQQRQTVHDYVGKFNSMSTYTPNADGTAGATDQAPNTAHPIVGLNVSASDISAFVGYGMNDFVSFLTGGAMGQTDRRGALGKLLP